jgi:hypothetical protein
VFHRHDNKWVKGKAKVIAVDRHSTTFSDGAPAVTVDGFVLEVQPADGEPFRANVEPAGFNHALLHVESSNFRHPVEGEIVSVEYDPESRAVRFDMSDPALQAKASRHAREDAEHAAYEDALNAPLGAHAIQGAPVEALAGLGDLGDLKARLLQMAAQNPGAVIDLRSSQPPTGQASDPVDRLAKLADLKDRGVLTDAEFAAEKAKILGES